MAYKMTPKRRAALKKAQAVSARKRRGKGKGKLAKANRSATRNRRIAVVAATGGLALAAAGVAGTYYARKTAGGGPKAPKINHSAHAGYQTKTKAVPAMTRHNALRAVSGARWGGVPAGRRTLLPKTSPSVDPGFSRNMGKPFTGDPGFSRNMGKTFTGDPGFTRSVRRGGPPRSTSPRAVFLRAQFRGKQSAQSRWRNRTIL